MTRLLEEQSRLAALSVKYQLWVKLDVSCSMSTDLSGSTAQRQTLYKSIFKIENSLCVQKLNH